MQLSLKEYNLAIAYRSVKSSAIYEGIRNCESFTE